MKLSLEEKIKLAILGYRASGLLVDVLDEPFTKEKIPTKIDIEFKKILSTINEICPILSEGYIEIYNLIQKEKDKGIEEFHYTKRLRKNPLI